MAHETQNAFAVWLTGLPASGKSRVTAALVDLLKQRDIRVAVLESDALRQSFQVEPGYDERDREYFYGSMALIGEVLVQHGINVIFDATANRRSYRDRARDRIPCFLEIHVDTPLEVCIQRDPKGIYARGKSGLSRNVPGLQVEYEAPLNADLVVHGDRESPVESARKIVSLLEARGIIRSSSG